MASDNKMKKSAIALLLIILLFLTGCGQHIPDYSKDPGYETLFTEDDSDSVRQIKSFIILHTETFNEENFDEYGEHYYGWDDAYKAAQADALSKTAQNVKTTREIVYLSAVFLDSDPNRAQVGAVIHTTLQSTNAETLADYTDKITYDLFRENSAWYIEQEDSENVGYFS